jgi:hypothetical protein
MPDKLIPPDYVEHNNIPVYRLKAIKTSRLYFRKPSESGAMYLELIKFREAPARSGG